MKKRDKFDFQVVATTIIGAVEKTFSILCHKLPGAPKIRKRPIVLWNRRMKVFGYEKFEKRTYISIVKLYLNTKDMDKERPFGVVILYIEEEYAVNLYTILGLGLPPKKPPKDNDVFGDEITEEDKLLMDTCGEFCNIITGVFKSDLVEIGCPDLLLAAPTNYKKKVPEEIEFPTEEMHKFEMFFPIDDSGARICLDIVIPTF